MAKLCITSSLAQYTGGTAEIEVEARTILQLFKELGARFPALKPLLEADSFAVAINGEIFQDAVLTPVPADSELFLVPRIAGGSALAFERSVYEISGIKTVVLSAGAGEPLVFFHGAGTFPGFDFTRPWTAEYRVHIPFHPGFGASADDPKIDSVHDYSLHYADLFDAMGLDRFDLVGHSLGGWLAAEFALLQGHRIKHLILTAPIGIKVANGAGDFFRITSQELPAYLVENLDVLKPYLRDDVDFGIERYRESTSAARFAWDRPYDPKLPRWLHRLTMPTLLVWGEKDRMLPFSHAEKWRKEIPAAETLAVKDAGHLVYHDAPETAEQVLAFLRR